MGVLLCRRNPGHLHQASDGGPAAWRRAHKWKTLEGHVWGQGRCAELAEEVFRDRQGARVHDGEGIHLYHRGWRRCGIALGHDLVLVSKKAHPKKISEYMDTKLKLKVDVAGAQADKRMEKRNQAVVTPAIRESRNACKKENENQKIDGGGVGAYHLASAIPVRVEGKQTKESSCRSPAP